METDERLSRRRALSLAAGVTVAPLLGAARAAGAEAFTPIKEEEAIIAFGYNGPVSDEGWSYQHHQGYLAAKQAFPKARFLEVESIPYSADATRTFRQFVAQRAKLVMLASEYGDLLYDVSKRSSQIAWMECNGHSVNDDLGWYYVCHWLPTYVTGIAAGLMSKSGKIGYVGSMPVPSVYAGVNSFLMGARSINPAATIQVILINSWFDPQAAYQAGTALLDNGCDFLFGIMDEPAYLQVAEKRGVPAVMWNTDERRFGPKSYVSSIVQDWGKFYIKQVGDRINGVWKPEGTLLGLGQGVDRDAWGDSVPEAVRRQADAVRSKMLTGWSPMVGEIKDAKGNIRIPKGQTFDDLAFYNCSWAMQGVSGL